MEKINLHDLIDRVTEKLQITRAELARRSDVSVYTLNAWYTRNQHVDDLELKGIGIVLKWLSKVEELAHSGEILRAMRITVDEAEEWITALRLEEGGKEARIISDFLPKLRKLIDEKPRQAKKVLDNVKREIEEVNSDD